MPRNHKLDQLRGFVAVYVMFAHAVYDYCRPLGIFGQEAVMIFFVLSGFVISYSVQQDESCTQFRNYFVKRARRIYPMFLIALPTVWVAMSYGVGQPYPVKLSTLLGNLFLIQDLQFVKPGIWFDVFINPNLWSISYEWWFYMAFFPLWRYVEAPKRKYVVGASSIAATVLYAFAPNYPCLVLSYFSLFWIGVEIASAYLETKQIPWARVRPIWLMTGVTGLLWVAQIALAVSRGQALSPGLYPLLQVRHFAAALGLVALALLWKKQRLVGFSRVFGFFERFSPISYGIYVYQWPILKASMLFLGLTEAVRTPLLCALVLAYAWVVESKLQPWFVRLSRPFLVPVARKAPAAAA